MQGNGSRALSYLCLAIGLFASLPATAAGLQAAAAGWTGNIANTCFADSGNVYLEIRFNVVNCTRQGIAEFDLSAIGTAEISSASLTLFNGYVANNQGTGRYWSIDIYGYLGEGQVSSADLNAGSYIKTAVWDSQDPAADVFATDVTEFVTSQLMLGSSVLGFNVRPTNPYACASCGTVFLAFDGAQQSSPPILNLTLVPLPGAFGLLISALLFPLTIRQRRKRVRADKH